MTPPPDHPAIPAPRIGVLLINLGTPDGPDTRSVRRYLKEFLSDRRVVEIPRIAWQPILRGIVLTTRPKKSAHAYRQVWREDGSPLAAITRAQSDALQGTFGEGVLVDWAMRYGRPAASHPRAIPDDRHGPKKSAHAYRQVWREDGSPLAAITRAQSDALQGAFGEGVLVDWAMRYGRPAIADRVQAMKEAGCERILLAPLYPQYCAATTATANDKAFAHLAGMRWQPAVRTLPPYHDDPAYVAALAASVEASLAKLDFVPDALITSFHGMPKRTLELGDPYHCHCRKTARLLGQALQREVTVAFQSRFGPAKWLGPATDETLAALAQGGRRKVAVVAPGFSADCLETLEELAIRGRESFLAAGGTDFAYLPCLNAEPGGIAMLRSILLRELAGWVTIP